jgi:hypothetical protein
MLSNRFTRGAPEPKLNNLAAMSPSNSRSRFLENASEPTPLVDADPDKPAKQKDRTPAAPSTAAPSGSKRTLARASRANSFSGRIDRRPSRESSAEKSPTGRRQSVIHDHADHAQPMIPANPGFAIDIAQQRSRPLVLTPHDSARTVTQKTESHRDSNGQTLYQHPASFTVS